ncbi:hypothetical protein [Hyphomicrobium sp. 2TAF46]|uniref:hypothetical protein n=1 Tax=Hyphomicrobium sp. 2TAF46 TaxID=3233019 RepID=UPI003F91CEDC
MSNVIELKKVKAERLLKQLEDDLAKYDRQSKAEIAAIAEFGFIARATGKDVWGTDVYSLAYDSEVLIDSSAELVADEVLELVKELLRFCNSPAEYRRHAQEFAQCMAESHAEADAAIRADWGIEPDAA